MAGSLWKSRNISMALLAIFLAFGCFPSALLAAEQRVITLSGSDGFKNSANGRWLALIYDEAFRRMGMKLEYVSYPAKRSSILSDEGKVDGEISRVYDYGENHPTMVRVDEPHFNLRFIAYSINPSLKLKGWASLGGKGFRIEHRMGVKKTKTALPNYVASDLLFAVRDVETGIKKLITGRSDLFVDVETVVDGYIENNPHMIEKKIYKSGVMEEVSGHVFFHMKNANLAPLLSSVLKEMKQEGLIEKFHEAAMIN